MRAINGRRPYRLIAVKIAAFLPLTVFGILTALFLAAAIQLDFYTMLKRAGLLCLLLLSATIISMAIACLGYNGCRSIRNKAIFEQVPLTVSAILAVVIEFLFCGIVFLPFRWLLFLSIAIPIICLRVQAIWLNRTFYSTGLRIYRL
ncbi:MAG: hypothetical protein Q4B96_01705 [Bacillota bacterium]|nr:hypothetical protein [Bacillota bacterium]